MMARISKFQKIVNEINPTDFISYRAYLKALYLHLKSHYKPYSYVLFSEQLGLGSCSASRLIITGKRPLTETVAKKICTILALTGVQRRFFLELVKASDWKQSENKNENFDTLINYKLKTIGKDGSKNYTEFLSCWYNAVILELLQLPDAKGDLEWISESLYPKVSPKKVKKSLILLQNLGFIIFDPEKKRFIVKQTYFQPEEGTPWIAYLNYHSQMIELAKQSIMKMNADQRYINSVTVAISEKKKDIFIKKLEELGDQFLSESAADIAKSEEIFQINFQLFPVSKKGSK